MGQSVTQREPGGPVVDGDVGAHFRADEQAVFVGGVALHDVDGFLRQVVVDRLEVVAAVIGPEQQRFPAIFAIARERDKGGVLVVR